MFTIPADAKARLDQAMNPRFDGVTGGIFLERELNHMLPQVLEERLPVLNAFSALPIDMSVPSYAKTYSRKMLFAHGVAKLISNYASDPPVVGLSASEDTYSVRAIGNAAQWSIDDIAASMANGISLDAKMLSAARRATEELQNRIAWQGDATHKLFGAANYPRFPRVALAHAISSASTADQILAVLHGLVNGIVSRTQQMARPSRLIMPSDEYSYIATTPRSTTSDTTILEFFLKSSPYVKEVLPVDELAGAGPNGEDVIMAFEPNIRVIAHIVPQMFTPLPLQSKNYTFLVPTIAKTGGVASDYPLEVAIGILP